MTAQKKPYYTPEQYLEMERASVDRSEYFNGEIYAMSGGSWNHMKITFNLSRNLGNGLEGGPCQIGFNDFKIRIRNGKAYAYPDIFGLCTPPEFAPQSDDILLNPEMIMEVLSPSTEKFDRGLKFAYYQQIPTLKEYLLVSQVEARIEQYVRQSDDTWILHIHRSMEEVVTLASMGYAFRLSVAYEGVTFPPPHDDPFDRVLDPIMP